MTLSKVAKNSSETISAFAPLSVNWYSSSRGVYSGLILVMISPTFQQANTAIGYCREFGIFKPTTSPF